jgi:hypothetical protein
VPHRGELVLALGTLSIVVACCPLAGWILGGIAIARANGDLLKMARGEMDVTGRGLTQAGRICAIFGVVISTLALLFHFAVRLNGF